MSRPSALGAVCYESESAFGENVSTFSIRLNHQGMVDASGLEQAKLACGNVQQLLQGGDSPIVGIKGGSFRTKFYLCGHGSTTSGSTTATAIPTILGYALGTSGVSAAAGTTFTGGTASVPTTTASGTFAAGSLCRGGLPIVGNTASDARASGQFAAILSHVTTTLTLLTAFPGAPTNGDVLYSAEMVYLNELPSSTAITGLRFLLQTANMEYECHGCYARSATFAVGVDGSLPTLEIEWAVAWWTYSTATFPSAVSVQTFPAAPGGGGNTSWFFQAKGTATRATRTVRSWSVSTALGNIPLVGPGGADQYQIITGAVRGPAKTTVTWTEDAQTATTTPTTETDWTNTTAKHGLLTLSSATGSAMAFYFPNLWPAEKKPVQFNDGGINRVKYTYDARADSTQATDLLASAMRIAFA